ncbi:thiamine-phosphate kinase [Cohnella cholangitidis]|uniref:Thiamine-monophosphate kinase n=1 Tax=Cohnella cholangitidis TaxID=2598458 RepID=A0A7G5C219_9BACL|nr:thiamine-phosphate kinase [Cohnella cholangitidis]QMV43253.1 thiamine-phosphate kinase [Cohnella cholangitidis]
MTRRGNAVLPLDEFGLIRAWTEGRQSMQFLAQAGVTVGIGDDAAVVAGSSGEEWLLAMDTMVEEVHFLDTTMSEADVGYKALAVNVSDIAAMGGIPKFALISVSIPPSWQPERMKLFYEGLYACADRYGVAVIGGDTTSSPQHLVVSVTVVGTVEAGRAIRRDGAQPGQLVFLTGPTGLSAGGLHGLLDRSSKDGSGEHLGEKPSVPPRLVQAHQRPIPSVKAGRILLAQGWGASLNDVSDGVASEAWEIAEASGVRLSLKETQLPLSGELASYARDQGLDPLEFVLYGGEDYVLLGTVDRQHELAMKEHFRAEGIPLFFIGEVEEGQPGVVMETSLGASRPISKRGYNHFPKG